MGALLLILGYIVLAAALHAHAFPRFQGCPPRNVPWHHMYTTYLFVRTYMQVVLAQLGLHTSRRAAKTPTNGHAEQHSNLASTGCPCSVQV